jgi:hypothetical protein
MIGGARHIVLMIYKTCILIEINSTREARIILHLQHVGKITVGHAMVIAKASASPASLFISYPFFTCFIFPPSHDGITPAFASVACVATSFTVLPCRNF